MPTLIRNGTASSVKALTSIGELFRETGGLDTSPRGLAKLGKASVWAYRCIIVKANMMSGIPLKAYVGDGDDKEEVEHPVLGDEALGAGATNKMRHVSGDLDVYGRAYLTWDKGVTGGVFRVHRLNPLAVQSIRDMAGQVIGYEYRPGGVKRNEYALDEICALSLLDWENDLGGLSPLAVAALAAGADRNMLAQVEAFFRNGALLSGMLTTDQTLQEPDIERLRSSWRRIYEGVRNFFKTFIAWGGIKFLPMQPEPKNLAMAELKEETRTDICAAFGISPALILTNAKYSNTIEARKSAYTEEIIPRCDYVGDELTRQLMRKAFPGDDVSLAFDYNQIEALREDQKTLYERGAAALATGVTFGEVMEMIGHEAPADAEMAGRRYIPTGLVELKDAATMQAEQQAKQEAQAEALARLNAPRDEPDDDDEDEQDEAEQMKRRRSAALTSVRMGQPVTLWGAECRTPGDVRAAFERHWPRPQNTVLVDLLAELKAARAALQETP